MNDNEVKCPQCGHVIGDLMEGDGIVLLRVGGGICRAFHGICAVCGEEIHWSVSEQALSRLMAWYLRAG